MWSPSREMLHFLLLLGSFTSMNTQRRLPCTSNVSPQDFQDARNIILGSIPPGYNLNELEAHVMLGRNPHRWIAIVSRNDGVYDCGCRFMQSVRQDFKACCPYGSEIRSISLRNDGNSVRFIVETLLEEGEDGLNAEYGDTRMNIQVALSSNVTSPIF